MNSSNTPKPTKGLCCLPIGQKHHRRKSKDPYLETSMQCENRCNNSIVYTEVESNVRSPKSLPHETAQWDTNQEHLAENNPTNLSLQTSPDDTVETSREHSATLTSLDIVVKRNSINGSVSSDMEDELDDASKLYCDTTSQECLPQQLGYAPHMSFSPRWNIRTSIFAQQLQKLLIGHTFH